MPFNVKFFGSYSYNYCNFLFLRYNDEDYDDSDDDNTILVTVQIITAVDIRFSICLLYTSRCV